MPSSFDIYINIIKHKWHTLMEMDDPLMKKTYVYTYMHNDTSDIHRGAQSTELVWILDFKQILLLFIIIVKLILIKCQ